MTSSHKDWLNNEYSQWIKALEESTVDNFGEHPMVKRMLGNVDMQVFHEEIESMEQEEWNTLYDIQCIGGDWLGGIMARMIYYAQQVLQQNPKAICEIGGGVGQFYAVLRALGYTGTYFIYDLPEVVEFQKKYLAEVEKRTGLNTKQVFCGFDFCVSFYCLGELDDDTKKKYIEEVVKKCPHGLIVWNAHSGASDEITFPCKIEPEYPLTAPNNKLLTW